MKRVFSSSSDAETRAIGAEIAGLLPPPHLLILSGDLGAGKTTLVKGIVQALQAEDEDAVTSPTFSLVHSYEGWWDGRAVTVLHLDLYRLEDERQVSSLGIHDWMTEDTLILVEWGEKFRLIQELADGSIQIASTGPESRSITVEWNEPKKPA